MKYPRGTIIVITSGAYSDFGIEAFLVSLADLDLRKLAKQFQKEEAAVIAKDKERRKWEEPRPSEFPTWLVARGFAAPIDHNTVHLGDYGNWDSEFDMGEVE